MARSRRRGRSRAAGPRPGRLPAHGVRRAARRLLTRSLPHALQVWGARLDLAIYRRIRSFARTPATVRWVRRYSRLGEHGAIWLGSGTLAAVLDRRRRPRWRRAALTVAVSYATSTTIKTLIGRHRPVVDDLPHLMATPTGLSFPSSHATSSFAAAMAYSRLVPARPLYAAAVAMAMSRLYLGVHYPSDVAAGAALGTAMGAFGR